MPSSSESDSEDGSEDCLVAPKTLLQLSQALSKRVGLREPATLHKPYHFDSIAILRIFEEWAKIPEPPVIPVELEHTYPLSPTFTLDSLHDRDKAVFAVLNDMARRVGLKVFLAELKHSAWSTWVGDADDHLEWCMQMTTPEAEGDKCTCFDTDEHVGTFLYDFDGDNGMSDYDQHEPKATTLHIGRIIDPCERSLPMKLSNITFDATDVINDAYFGKDIEDIREDYETRGRGGRDFGRGKADVLGADNYHIEDLHFVADLTLDWNNTAIVICPNSIQTTAADILDYCVELLENSTSSSPDLLEMEAVTYLLDYEPRTNGIGDYTAIARILTKSSVRWSDVNLWIKTVDHCGITQEVSRIEIEGYISVYESFPWFDVNKTFEQVLSNEADNEKRCGLVSSLEDSARRRKDIEVVSWCRTAKRFTLAHLQPILPNQIPWLQTLLVEYGVVFFHESLFPQIQRMHCDVDFLLRLARMINRTSRSTNERLPRAALLGTIATLAANQFSAWSSPVDDMLEICWIGMPDHHSDACRSLFNNLELATTAWEDLKVGTPPWKCYPSLVVVFDDLFRRIQVPSLDEDPWSSFFLKAAQVILQYTSWKDEDILILVTAIKRAGGIAFLKPCLTTDCLARLLQTHDVVALERLTQQMYRMLLPPASSPFQCRDLADIMVACTNSRIAKFPFSTLHQLAPSQSFKSLKALLDFCLSSDVGSETIPGVFRHLGSFADTQDANGVKVYLTRVLVPSGPLLNFVTTHTDSLVGLCKSFYGQVAKKYVSDVLRPRPKVYVLVPEPLKTFGCDCEHCEDARAFFSNPTARTHNATGMKKTVWGHLQEELFDYNPNAVGIKWVIDRKRSPYTMIITKPAEMVDYPIWLRNRETALILLRTLGDEGEQRRILGGYDYDWIQAMLADVENDALVGRRNFVVKVDENWVAERVLDVD